MSDGNFPQWQEENRQLLTTELNALLLDITRRRIRDQPAAGGATPRETMKARPAIDLLAAAFDLTTFERSLVLRCLADEIDPQFRTELGINTIGSALTTLPEANWSELDDASTLLSWGILTRSADEAYMHAELRLANDVRRFLLGFDPTNDHRLPVTFTRPEADPAADPAAAAQRSVLRAASTAMAATDSVPIIELHGGGAEDRQSAAESCAIHLDATLGVAALHELPLPGDELDAVLRHWSRVCRLSGSVAALEVGAGEGRDPRLAHTARQLRDLFIILTPQVLPIILHRPVVRARIDPSTPQARAAAWRRLVIERADRVRRPLDLDPDALPQLASRYRLSPTALRRAFWVADAEVSSEASADELVQAMAGACRQEVRSRLAPVAERVQPDPTSVVLPPDQQTLLAEFIDQIRHHREVGEYATDPAGQSRGPLALFAGPSGTGKTLAASTVARHCGMDLYRVDLGSVLSKWIGETEQNLDRIFDAAEIGGVILLFDEADALFGKRSEVREGRDRYANAEVSHLLQRVERAAAVSILTTNLKDAIDPAFLRRIDITIDFPFPGRPEREAIWRRLLAGTDLGADPTPSQLAELAVTGAAIGAIARRATLLAAAATQSLDRSHLLTACRRELRKIGRELTAEEAAAWS